MNIFPASNVSGSKNPTHYSAPAIPSSTSVPTEEKIGLLINSDQLPPGVTNRTHARTKKMRANRGYTVNQTNLPIDLTSITRRRGTSGRRTKREAGTRNGLLNTMTPLSKLNNQCRDISFNSQRLPELISTITGASDEKVGRLMVDIDAAYQAGDSMPGGACATISLFCIKAFLNNALADISSEQMESLKQVGLHIELAARSSSPDSADASKESCIHYRTEAFGLTPSEPTVDHMDDQFLEALGEKIERSLKEGENSALYVSFPTLQGRHATAVLISGASSNKQIHLVEPNYGIFTTRDPHQILNFYTNELRTADSLDDNKFFQISL